MNPLDRLFLERACELARRGCANTSPNPAVGAVVVSNGTIVGEGYHHRAGEPHAEVLALQAANGLARRATLYVTLEPCNHRGRTGPCTDAIVDAGIARVVFGASDPNRESGAGAQILRSRGIDTVPADDAQARALIEPFSRSISRGTPYVSLKMASSLDGYVAAQPGRRQWLTGERAAEFVRELRILHDAVIVGAGTIRIDNPQLTVRPAHHRLRPYARIVACERDPVEPASAVFSPVAGYARTIVLAPAGPREAFRPLQDVAEVVFVGDSGADVLDLKAALRALKERGMTSVLCEGGPTMAGALFQDGLVDRFHWLIAPLLLRTAAAVPVLCSGTLDAGPSLRIDCVERLGEDVHVSGVVDV